jgi:hypothetical protein
MKRLFPALIFSLILVGIISVQFFSDQEKAKAKYVEPMVLRPELVKAIDLGLHNTAADLMWLSSIQYFGGGESKNYSKMPDFLNFTSDVDPKFAYPYAFGALILSCFGYVDQGLALADKGIANGVKDWRIPYYAATTYYFNKDDGKNALKYFDLAANTPGAPKGIQQVAANFGSNTNKRQKTEQIWESIYQTTKDDVVKKRAQNYLIHFSLLDLLDNAAAQYYKSNNKYPATPQDLVTARILKAVPTDPFGMEFKFDNKGQTQASLPQ